MISSSHSTRNADTIPLLDVIRFLAAWMVLAWHTGDHMGVRLPIFSSAAIAVDVFMNVSGFLMLFHFLERQDKEPWNAPTTWWRFYIRRFFRIAPLYYFGLLLLVVTGLTPANANPPDTTLSMWQWLLLRFSFLFGFSPHQSINCAMPDWSLSLEMQFYFCFPFLALALRRLKAGLFFFLCAVVAAVSRFLISYYDDYGAGYLAHFNQPTVLTLKLHTFAVGMVVALVLIRGVGELRSKWFWAAFPVYLLTCKENFLWLLAVIYWTGYIVCLIPTVRDSFFKSLARVDQLLQRLPFRKILADCSYGTYLFHSVVIALVLAKIWPRVPYGQGSLLQFIAALALVLGLTTLVSWMFLWVIEKPGINLGKALLRKMGKRVGTSNNQHPTSNIQ